MRHSSYFYENNSKKNFLMLNYNHQLTFSYVDSIHGFFRSWFRLNKTLYSGWTVLYARDLICNFGREKNNLRAFSIASVVVCLSIGAAYGAVLVGTLARLSAGSGVLNYDSPIKKKNKEIKCGYSVRYIHAYSILIKRMCPKSNSFSKYFFFNYSPNYFGLFKHFY